MKKRLWIPVFVLIIFALVACSGQTTETTPTVETTLAPTTEPVETTAPPPVWESGYLASGEATVTCLDGTGAEAGTLYRGTQVEYLTHEDGKIEIRHQELTGFLTEAAWLVQDPMEVIPAHTQYVRTAVNLRDAEGHVQQTLAPKGQAVEITGYDSLQEGQPHMYRVNLDGEEGYIAPWYLVTEEEEALSNYDHNGYYATHEGRTNRYGGGGAADLDYFPREKGPIEGNDMPEECRTLYLVAWRVSEVDAYIEMAKSCDINAFVVDIVDGGSIGYASEVMQKNCPSAAAAACNTVEEYRYAIQRLKEEGFYVIGRITTFNDSFYVKDHPEYAISNTSGSPLKLSGEYWPTPYNRSVWQYKVDLAVEAVELMGFNEIQFDYVRFPDRTYDYESAGTIDFRNTYGESKAQAIQRFLMYATDILHENGAYISADVYGESAYTYVTGYGQYWPAISNVVDVISGMPYPDHFGASGDWRPWEHPYETLNNWGQSVMIRQKETATPAAVRTWIQAYNAIREPYNTYGPDQVAAEIKGLRDAGCTGGFMTWHSTSSLDKYWSLAPAFKAPASEKKEEKPAEETTPSTESTKPPEETTPSTEPTTPAA